MFNRYLVLLIGLLAVINIPATIATGICTCYCCDAEKCDPIYESSIEVPTCLNDTCLTNCTLKFPFICDASGNRTISASCSDVTGDSSTATSSESSSTTTTSEPLTTITSEASTTTTSESSTTTSSASSTAITSEASTTTTSTSSTAITSESTTTTTSDSSTGATSETTITTDTCTCYCCDGEGCDPIYEGSIEVPTCLNDICRANCRLKFPFACGAPGNRTISASCGTTITPEPPTTTTSEPSTTTTSEASTTTTSESSTTTTSASSTAITSEASTTTTSESSTTTTSESSTTTTSESSTTTTFESSTRATSETTITTDTCNCYCCDGEGCDPIYEGSIEVPTCSNDICRANCRLKFPFACGAPGNHTISASCGTTTTSEPPTATTPESSATTTGPATITVTITTTPGQPGGACTNRESPIFIALLATAILAINIMF